MKEYDVTLFEVVKHTARVSPADKSSAYEKAYEVIANGPNDGYDTEAEGFTGDWMLEEV
jgi:hypothetical protein